MAASIPNPFKKTISKLFRSNLLILLVSCALHLVKCTLVEIDTFETNTVTLSLNSMHNFKTHLVNVLIERKTTKLVINFQNFESPDSLLKFLGLSFKNSKFTNAGNDEESMDIQYNSDLSVSYRVTLNEGDKYEFTGANSHSEDTVCRTLQQLTALKLQMDDSISSHMNSLCLGTSADGIASSLQVIYSKFSDERQGFVRKEITRYFPNSIISKTLKQVSKEPIDNLWDQYKTKLNSMAEQENVMSELTAEREVLRIVVLTLFFDKIIERLFQKWKMSLQTVSFSIGFHVPIFLNTTAIINMFPNSILFLSGPCFASHQYAFVHFLNISQHFLAMEVDEYLLREIYDALNRIHIGFKGLKHKDTNMCDVAMITTFKKLKYLKLVNISDNSDIKKIRIIKEMPNLEKIEFDGPQEALGSFLCNLKQIINYTKISSFIYYRNLSGHWKCVELRKSQGIRRFHDVAFNIHFAEQHEIAKKNKENTVRNSLAVTS